MDEVSTTTGMNLVLWWARTRLSTSRPPTFTRRATQGKLPGVSEEVIHDDLLMARQAGDIEKAVDEPGVRG
jgi:hypothetical protein